MISDNSIQDRNWFLRAWVSFRQFFVDVKTTFKTQGMRAVLRRYGWKVFALFFVYYLIRDSILYILLPYLAAQHFFKM